MTDDRHELRSVLRELREAVNAYRHADPNLGVPLDKQTERTDMNALAEATDRLDRATRAWLRCGTWIS